MIITHAGIAPRIDPAAWVAPDATICGDVEIAAGARVLHGARIVGEAGGSIRIGRNVIVMENAVVRAGPRHPCSIGDHCLIGPARPHHRLHHRGAGVRRHRRLDLPRRR